MKESPCWHIGAGLLVLASSLICGCSAIPGGSATPATPAAPVPPAAVKLTYRTTADRLNVAGAGTQLASYQQPTAGSLPGFSTTTLIITSPHPAGVPGYAQATVVIKPEQPATTAALSIWPWQKDAAAESPNPASAATPREVWVLDIPQWQVDAVVTKLRNANFFQRSKILGADAFLAAEAGPQKIAKDCKSLPELDALILRSRVEGRLVSGGPLLPTPPPALAMPPGLAPPQFASPPSGPPAVQGSVPQQLPQFSPAAFTPSPGPPYEFRRP